MIAITGSNLPRIVSTKLQAVANAATPITTSVANAATVSTPSRALGVNPRLLKAFVVMKPRISVITLAVQDLDRSLTFYRDGLGLPTKGVVGTEFRGTATDAAGAVVFFELEGGLLFALYPRSELAKDAEIMTAPASSTEFSIAHIVESKDAVDKLLECARAAGAVVTGIPHERPWGIYSGYFKDPDGHLWEVIWNPNPSE